MRIDFTDGYIIINKKGNTYLGGTAHKIMHIASETARECDADYQETLVSAIYVYRKLLKDKIKEIKFKGGIK